MEKIDVMAMTLIFQSIAKVNFIYAGVSCIKWTISININGIISIKNQKSLVSSKDLFPVTFLNSDASLIFNQIALPTKWLTKVEKSKKD